MPKLTLIRTARELVKKHDFSGPLLKEAIPYINEFAGKCFVLKIGGSVLNDPDLRESLIDDVVFLKRVGINLILVHGGSRQLDKEMAGRGIEPQKKDGLRVTSAEVLDLAADVFGGISREIGEAIKNFDYKYAIFDRESGLVKSKKKASHLDLGYVGDPDEVNVSLLNTLADDVIPIISSITSGTKAGEIGYNVNADDVAGVVASSIKAEKLILMTDEEGVLDKSGELLSSLTVSEVKKLIEDGTIHGGMIPKVSTCLKTLEAGVHKCHIIKGSEDSFIGEILTDHGVGTEFVSNNDLEAHRLLG